MERRRAGGEMRFRCRVLNVGSMASNLERDGSVGSVEACWDAGVEQESSWLGSRKVRSFLHVKDPLIGSLDIYKLGSCVQPSPAPSSNEAWPPVRKRGRTSRRPPCQFKYPTNLPRLQFFLNTAHLSPYVPISSDAGLAKADPKLSITQIIILH